MFRKKTNFPSPVKHGSFRTSDEYELIPFFLHRVQEIAITLLRTKTFIFLALNPRKFLSILPEF